MPADRSNVSLAGDLLNRTKAERDRLSASSKVNLSLSSVALSLIREALDARDAQRTKRGGAK